MHIWPLQNADFSRVSLERVLTTRSTDWMQDYCTGCSKLFPRKDMKVCTGCRAERYCSKECQKKTWSAHKTTCKALSKLRAEALKKDLNGFTNPQTSGRCLVRITGYEGRDADTLEGKTAMVLACTDTGNSSVQLTAVQDGVDTLAPGLQAMVPQKNLEPYVEDFRLGMCRQWGTNFNIMIARMTLSRLRIHSGGQGLLI